MLASLSDVFVDFVVVIMRSKNTKKWKHLPAAAAQRSQCVWGMGMGAGRGGGA